MKLTIISNPISGRKNNPKQLKVALNALKSNGIFPVLRETSRRGDARIFAQEEVRKGTEIVLAAGGDGTINEVANGLVGSSVSLAVLPLGTANVFSLEIQVPSDPVRAIEILLKGSTQSISLGHIKTRDISGRGSKESYFLLMAGIGFDGGVLHEIKRGNIARWGKAAYIALAIQVISKYTNSLISIRIDHDEPVSGYSVIVGNAHYYGGKFQVTPCASLRDDYFDLCVFTRKGALGMLKNALQVFQGTHLYDKGTLYRKAKTIEVSSPHEVFVQTDGDVQGRLPAYLTVQEKALSVIVP